MTEEDNDLDLSNWPTQVFINSLKRKYDQEIKDLQESNKQILAKLEWIESQVWSKL